VFSGDDGVIYAVTRGGDLLRYKDLARNGSEKWAPVKTIGIGGWDQFSEVFSGGEGVIYAVTRGGDLRWYRDLNLA
jgi:hypothetical protein